MTKNSSRFPPPAALLGIALIACTAGCSSTVTGSPTTAPATASSTATATASAPTISTPSTTPTVTGRIAAIVVQIDCGTDGAARVRVQYGTAPAEQVLVSRRPQDHANVEAFTGRYGIVPGFADATLTVTTSPTHGACTTTLTNRSSGDVVAKAETPNEVTLTAVVSTGS